MTDPDFAKSILDLELSLFDKRFMSDAAYLDAVIADGFEECGKSGKVYGKEETISFLLACDGGRDIAIDNFRCREVGDGAYLANYETEHEGKAFYRTSVWVDAMTPYGYELVFHQATMLDGCL